MTRSVRGGRSGYSVYLRGGKPCLTCGTPITVEMLGLRWTWWCPRCQELRPAVSGNRSRRG